MSVARPLFLQNLTDYTALEFANLIAALFPNVGVLAGAAAVTANSPVGMSVLVAPGFVIAPSRATPSSKYLVRITATETAVITVATSLPRIDNVVVELDDTAFADASDSASVVVVAGTPNASPVAPAVGANQLLLATVAVAASASSIVAGNITDKRAPAAPGGDTGWLTITAAAGYVQGTDVPQVRNRDGVLYFRGLIAAASGNFAASASLTVASALPAGCTPAYKVNVPLSASTPANDVRGILNTNGSVQFITSASTGTYADLAAFSGALAAGT